MTKKIKQVQISNYGNADVLELIESDMPQVTEGEVLIKVSAIGVNYSDILRREDKYFMPTPLPYVLGTEAVGVIEEVGGGVSEPYVVGTRVLAILPQAGGYATYVAAQAQYCVPLPPEVDDKSATAIFVQGSTAQLMMDHVAGDLKGKTVLINAAAGGVGSLLVQLAKLKGAKVIGAVGSDAKADVVKRLGADLAVNYSNSNWSESLKDANDGNGVDVVFEMVGGDVYNESLKCLARGGHIIVFGCAGGIQGTIHPEYFVDQNIAQSGFNLAYFIQNKIHLWQEALGTIITLLIKKQLKIEIPETFKLEAAADAHRKIEARQTTGKVVLLT